jgi:hypothetical protein
MPIKRSAPSQIAAVIASEISRQSKNAPSGTCTLSFGSGDIVESGMTNDACTTAARLTNATAVTWVENIIVPGEDMDHGNGP